MDRQTMWKTLNLFSLPGLALLLLACVTRPATQIEGPEKVETREWSKNEGVVHYSGWKSLSAMTVDRLPGYHTAGSTTYGRYGGIPEKKTKATGFFHTLKTGDRWWIIDPDGNPGLNVAVNAVRPGTSERNKNALAGKFGDEKNWISQTHQKLISLGFNGTGSWSETRLVRYDNQNSLKPLSYTLIWNFFAGYQRQRNRTEKEKFSFPVFDPEFETYCDSIGKKLIESAEDPNLLGHFSDNELVFNLRI
ncbi:MAG: hypothetical protein WCI71_01495, partial [Bacteroidota bacterium]